MYVHVHVDTVMYIVHVHDVIGDVERKKERDKERKKERHLRQMEK